MIYLGVDPGQNGGFAEINGPFIKAFKYTDTDLIALIQDHLKCHPDISNHLIVYIEDVIAFQGSAKGTNVKQGKNWGIIVGILKAFMIEPIVVRPSIWKKEFGLWFPKLSYKEKKKLDIDKAKRLFPNVNLIPPRCKVEHDGLADALLIAEYGRRQHE